MAFMCTFFSQQQSYTVKNGACTNEPLTLPFIDPCVLRTGEMQFATKA